MSGDHFSELSRTVQHLGQIDKGALSEVLAERRVRVAIGVDASSTYEGQLLATTVVNLIARCCPRLEICAPSAELQGPLNVLTAMSAFNADELVAYATRIWSSGNYIVAQDPSNPDVTLTVGTVDRPGDLGVGLLPAAAVRLATCVRVERSATPWAALIGAATAASMAVQLFLPEVFPRTKLPEEIILADGALGVMGGNPGPLRNVTLAGAGATGSAAVYALIAAGATGQITLVDPDVIDDSNLMRYALFDTRHLSRSKADVAAELLRASGIECEPHPQTLGNFLRAHPEHRDNLGTLVTAVDTYSARRDICLELPQEIVNVGTTASDFTVSYHRFHGELACLSCLYPERHLPVERAAVLSRETGLPIDRVKDLLGSRSGLTDADLGVIAAHTGKGEGHYDGWVATPLESFYRKEVCGTAPVLQDSAGETFAPMAFGSAMAGFLTAHALQAGRLDHSHFRMNFLRGLHRPLQSTPTGSCSVCSNQAFIDAYEARWSGRPFNHSLAGRP